MGDRERDDLQEAIAGSGRCRQEGGIGGVSTERSCLGTMKGD